jgi:curli biogenesis system outer membrane secretion channel CsgG
VIKTTTAFAAILLASCAPSKSPKPTIPESERLVLAMAGVTSKVTPEGPPVAEAASECLLDALVSSGRFRVVERENLDLLLEEHRNEKYSRIGKLAGAEWIVYGAITEVVFRGDTKQEGLRHFGEVQLQLRVVRVEDGVIIYSKGHRGIAEGPSTSSPDGLLKRAARSAVEKLAGEIVELAP